MISCSSNGVTIFKQGEIKNTGLKQWILKMFLLVISVILSMISAEIFKCGFMSDKCSWGSKMQVHQSDGSPWIRASSDDTRTSDITCEIDSEEEEAKVRPCSDEMTGFQVPDNVSAGVMFYVLLKD